jgi:cysteine desulfurase
MRSSIYLDHAATSPLRPEVRAAMDDLRSESPGNPSSIHRWVRRARSALEEARSRIASLLRARPEEIHFVRGGTESINLAILGWVDHARRKGGPRDPVLYRSALEHSAVRECMDAVEGMGAGRTRVLPAAPSGEPDLSLLEAPEENGSVSGPRPTLVSCQWVNPETGIVLPVEALAEVCEGLGVPIHVDGVQAAGRLPIELDRIPVSLLSLSGHKFGGPVGTGILFVRSGTELRPRLFGGGQEGGLRPGTEDVVGAVGFARGLELAVEARAAESERLSGLRTELERALCEALPGLRIFGKEAPRAPHILGIGIPGLPRDLLPSALDVEGIGTSAGSACRSGTTEVSPVLEALYGEEARKLAPLRISLGWSTTPQEIQAAARRIPPVVERARELLGG